MASNAFLLGYPMWLLKTEFLALYKIDSQIYFSIWGHKFFVTVLDGIRNLQCSTRKWKSLLDISLQIILLLCLLYDYCFYLSSLWRTNSITMACHCSIILWFANMASIISLPIRFPKWGCFLHKCLIHACLLQIKIQLFFDICAISAPLINCFALIPAHNTTLQWAMSNLLCALSTAQ